MLLSKFIAIGTPALGLWMPIRLKAWTIWRISCNVFQLPSYPFPNKSQLIRLQSWNRQSLCARFICLSNQLARLIHPSYLSDILTFFFPIRLPNLFWLLTLICYFLALIYHVYFSYVRAAEGNSVASISATMTRKCASTLAPLWASSLWKTSSMQT